MTIAREAGYPDLQATLQARAERALRDLRSFPDPEYGVERAVIGPARIPDEAVQAAMEALRSGRATPAHLTLLEQVIRTARPAPLVHRGEIGPWPEALVRPPAAWEAFSAAARPFLDSIGRVDRRAAGSGAGAPTGTGFLVEPSLLLTNLHVLDQLSGSSRRLDRGQVEIRFGAEWGASPEPGGIPPADLIQGSLAVPIIDVAAVQPELDLALLRLDRDGDAVERRPLLFEAAPPEVGTPVVTIGFPLDDTARNPLFVRELFEGVFGAKRASPGEIIELRLPSLFHDCTTLGGNSGSPVLSLATARVVAVHSSGMFLYRNAAIAGTSAAAFVAETKTSKISLG